MTSVFLTRRIPPTPDGTDVDRNRGKRRRGDDVQESFRFPRTRTCLAGTADKTHVPWNEMAEPSFRHDSFPVPFLGNNNNETCYGPSVVLGVWAFCRDVLRTENVCRGQKSKRHGLNRLHGKRRRR